MPEFHNPTFSSSGQLSPDLSPTIVLLLCDKLIPPFPSLLSPSVQSQQEYPVTTCSTPPHPHTLWDCISQGDREDEGSSRVVTITEKLGRDIEWFNMKLNLGKQNS